MSPPHWFLGKGQGPLRDGRPSFEEELAKMPPIADSCYRRLVGPVKDGYVTELTYALDETLPYVRKVPAPWTPEPDEPSPD